MDKDDDFEMLPTQPRSPPIDLTVSSDEEVTLPQAASSATPTPPRRTAAAADVRAVTPPRKRAPEDEASPGPATCSPLKQPKTDIREAILAQLSSSAFGASCAELANALHAPWGEVGSALAALSTSHGILRAESADGSAPVWFSPSLAAPACGVAGGPAAVPGAKPRSHAEIAGEPADTSKPAESLRRSERKAAFKASRDRPLVKIAEMQHAGSLYDVGGLSVRFVEGMQPQPPQLEVMRAAAAALTAQRDSLATAAWLESPTGTGKSIALLSTVLAYQASVACVDPKATPVVFYVSRTHNQLDAMVSSTLRRLAYRPVMTLLPSRARLCLHPPALTPGADRAFECEKAMYLSRRAEGTGCAHVENAEATYFPAAKMELFAPGGTLATPEIEDLVAYGQQHTVCPYHLTRDLLGEGAGLVFLTYGQLLNPAIRSANNLNLLTPDCVVVFDEGHNVAGAARDAATLIVKRSVITMVVREVDRFWTVLKNAPIGVEVDPKHFATLAELKRIAVETHNWLESVMRPGYNPNFAWAEEDGVLTCIRGGDEAQYVVCERVGVTASGLSRLRTSIREMRASLIEANGESAAVKSDGINAIEDMVTKFEMLLGASPDMFKLILRRRSGDGFASDDEEYPSAMFLCLNGSVALAPILQSAGCVLFASGTLGSVALGAAELGLDLSRTVTCSAMHHEGVRRGRQLLTFALTSGKDSVGKVIPFSFTYSAMGGGGTATGALVPSSSALIDALSCSLLAMLARTPDGSLIFFPSRGMLERCLAEFDRNGFIRSLEALTSLNGKRTPCVLVDLPGSSPAQCADIVQRYREKAANPEASTSCSAVLLSVMRGKISEGADFSGPACRGVFVVGLPLPPVHDVATRLKRAFQDEHATEPETGGDAYYLNEAVRCASQAIGRCIRHANDYGAAVLIDTRYAFDGGEAGTRGGVRDKLPQYARLLLQTVGSGESTSLGQAISQLDYHFAACRAAAAVLPPPPAALSTVSEAAVAIKLEGLELDDGE